MSRRLMSILRRNPVIAVKRQLVRKSASELAQRIVEQVADGPSGLLSKPPPTGYMRGIDYYDRKDLIRAITRVLVRYRERSGHFPNLIEPISFTEKLTRAKFFAAMKVPETGNKSHTVNFIPKNLDGKVSYPRIVWRSRNSILPANHQLAAGIYYLKTNHGSGMVRRVAYPLSPSVKAALEEEFAGFLCTDYGKQMGQWWYNVFERELILEEAVCVDDPPTTLLFLVIDGEIAVIWADHKSLDVGGVTPTLQFDPVFNIDDEQPPGEERLENFEISEELKRRTIEIAKEIGKQFFAIRVDLIIGDDGEVYLNEITQMSEGGDPAHHTPKFNMELGKKWVGNEIYRLD